MQFIDKKNNKTFGLLHFLQNRLQSLLELSTVLGTGNERTQIQNHNPLVLDTLWHILSDNALCQAFYQCRLPDSWIANQHGVVLRTSRQDLDDAADFVVPPNYRIQSAPTCQTRQITTVTL